MLDDAIVTVRSEDDDHDDDPCGVMRQANASDEPGLFPSRSARGSQPRGTRPPLGARPSALLIVPARLLA